MARKTESTVVWIRDSACGRMSDPLPQRLAFHAPEQSGVGGAGVVRREGTGVEKRVHGSLSDLGLWDEKYVEPLARIVCLVRSLGAEPGAQLTHAGTKARCRAPPEGRGAMERSDDIPDRDAWRPIAPPTKVLGDDAETHAKWP